MPTTSSTLSTVRKKRLHVQGYEIYSDKELNEYKYGIRFAYALCTTMVALGLIFNSLPLLMTTAVVALGGVILPYHPFDYLYNNGARYLFKKSRIPHRTKQGRFACGVAFVWLSAVSWLLYAGHFIAGYFLGSILLFVAVLVSTLDICIPSMVYNFLFKKKGIRTNQSQ